MMPGPWNPWPALSRLTAVGVALTGALSLLGCLVGWLLRLGGVL